MILPASLTQALKRYAVTWTADAPLAKRTWWRVGGTADAYAEVADAAAVACLLAEAAAAQVPVTVLGNGSNVLVADAGVEGLVLHLTDALTASEIDGDVLSAGAALANTVLLARLAKAGHSGLACLAGIPGTLGGAVAMNAGQTLGEIRDTLLDVQLATPEGRLVTLPAEALNLGYRHAELPAGSVIVGVRTRLGADPTEPTRIAEFLAHRKATQPLDKPSIGSTFTNPPGDSAGRLIDAAGLKGLALGGAVVSDKHANFLLNTSSATATELAQLVSIVAARVEAHHGVKLQPEVRLLGRWGEVNPAHTTAWR